MDRREVRGQKESPDQKIIQGLELKTARRSRNKKLRRGDSEKVGTERNGKQSIGKG